MPKNYTQYPDKFVAYEVNRISCDFDDEEHFLDAINRLEKEGLDKSTFYILQGPEGIKAFDPTGVEHGTWSMLSRKLHSAVSEAEEQAINDLVEDLEQGMIHLAVPAKKLKTRDLVHHIMDEAGGHHTKYTDRFFVENYAKAQ